MTARRPLIFDIAEKTVREMKPGDSLYLEGGDETYVIQCKRGESYLFTIDNWGNLQSNGINIPAGMTYDVDGNPHTHAGLVRTAKQTAQITNSSNTTPTDITGLRFDLVSGRRYAFKFFLTFQSVATGTGVGFVFSSPTMTAANWKASIRQGAAGTDMTYENSATSLTTELINVSVVAANTDYMAIIEGFCEPSADGSLQLQCRSEVNGSQVMIKNSGIGYLIDAG